jgi:hypothetical protein
MSLQAIYEYFILFVQKIPVLFLDSLKYLKLRVFNDYQQFLEITKVLLNQIKVLTLTFEYSKKILDKVDFDIIIYFGK